MRKTVLLFLLLICIIGCVQKDREESTMEESPVNIANPFITYGGLEELNANSEVPFTSAPEEINGYLPVAYRYAKELNLSEVIYERNEGEKLIIRKTPYYLNEDNTIADISGDTNSYDEHGIVDGVDFAFYFSGNNGRYNVLRWDDGISCYAIVINPGTDNGLNMDLACELVRSIH